MRAAMIFNLLKFITWPQSLPANAPLQICLIETSSPLSEALQELNKRTIGTHALSVRTIQNGDIAGCEIAATDTLQTLYETTRLQKNVLSIGDTGFIDRGGMIGIVKISNRIRFEINTTALQSAGISLPAQVLQLAVRTR